jgi:hypothetical protein
MEVEMKKVRTTSWFLLLAILLAIFVSFTMAQETPPVTGGQIFRYDSPEPLTSEPLARSSEVIQTELSADSQNSLSFSAASANLSPLVEEDTSQEPTDPVDTSVATLPDELQNSLVPGGSSPIEPEIPFSTSEHRFDFSGRHVGLPQLSLSPSAAGETCKQLLQNSKLDMIGGSFPPWVVLEPRVYFSDTDYKSAQHSLLFVDNDTGDDDSPTMDAFGQAFSVPSNLTQVTIKYYTKSLDSNTTDDAFGHLYTVDANGVLDQLLGGWEVGQSPGAWQLQTVPITDPAALQPMEDQVLAIVLLSDTNASAPNELVLFDDIEFTACSEDAPDSYIIVKKQTDPDGASQKFTFNPSWSASNFQLSDGQSKQSGPFAPGTYSVSELPVSGWTQTSATCDNGSNPGSISLQAGETVTCTFHNKEDPGQIIVKKQTDPDGASQKFTFDPSWSASNFQLSDGQSKQSGDLAPGTYSVSELPVSGWTQTSATCDDGSNPGSISLQAGKTVTCTFHNKKVADADAYIIVWKQTGPAGTSQKFTFVPSWTSNFQLADGDSKISQALSPGTYSVKELPQTGWKLTGATCSDGSNPANISLQAGETVVCVFRNLKASCDQVLENTKMDVVELGDGTGTVEPWSIIFQKVYYTNDPNLAYDGYSMVLVDGDPPDTSPEIDMFGQGFVMPDNLTEFSAEYMFATLGTNLGDEAYGELYLLDDDWTLHWPDENYFVGRWTVAESQGAWARQTITSNDPSFLNKMAGKKVAILLYTDTDGDDPKEDVFFDNVMFTACSKAEPFGGKIFLPSIMKDYGQATGPICRESNENPLDQFNSNRGLVQTGATCSGKLSNVDIKDYYAFKPSKDGNHTLWLTNLPEKTQWSATMFVDADPYPFAPGSADGKCFTSQPGHGDKEVVCNLKKGNDYFVRIDSGSTPIAGSYKMKITAP